MAKAKTSTRKKAARPQKRSELARGRRPAGRSWWRMLIYWASVAAVWVGFAVFALVIWYAYDLPDPQALERMDQRPTIRLVSESGAEIADYNDLYGNKIQLSQVSPNLIKAVLATEDRRFYDHFGVDLIGLTRALISNIAAGRVVQGGSTITQQLAKNAFLTSERTIKRKVQEVILALWLEQKYTKDEILTRYLNRVYLGAGTYGVEAAAQKYFGRSAANLEINQAAMLAGLLKAPSYYAPTNHLKRAQQRAQTVIANMVEADFLSEARAASITPATLSRRWRSYGGRYFADWILNRIPDYIGPAQGDVTVVTTLDPDLQRAAEEIVEAAIQRNRKALNVSEVALVILSPDGAVRAMVGGRSYRASSFNRVTQAKRQPGSAFKPFVYAAALEAGMRTSSRFTDQPIRIGDWQPKNYDNKYYGDVTMQQAMARSMNSVAVQISEQVGRNNVIEMAHRLGIVSPIRNHPSVSLGTSEVSLLELTQAYLPFANGGIERNGFGIVEIIGGSDTVLYRRAGRGIRVLSDSVLSEMNKLLQGVVREGTGKGAKLSRPTGGKTGTSQSFRDAWFVGYSTDYVGGVWVGNDNGAGMKGLTGGGLPARVWRDVMREAHRDKPVRDLPTVPTEPTTTPVANLVLRLVEEIVGTSVDTSPSRRRDNVGFPGDREHGGP